MENKMFVGIKYSENFLPPEEIQKLTEDDSICYIEKIDDAIFEKYNPGTQFSDSFGGRIFSSKFELKWKRYDNCFHFVAFSPDKTILDENGWQDVLELDYVENTHVILWGDKDQKEKKIPHKLGYPNQISRGKITVERFRSKEHGDFIKYKNLEEYKK